MFCLAWAITRRGESGRSYQPVVGIDLLWNAEARLPSGILVRPGANGIVIVLAANLVDWPSARDPGGRMPSEWTAIERCKPGICSACKQGASTTPPRPCRARQVARMFRCKCLGWRQSWVRGGPWARRSDTGIGWIRLLLLDTCGLNQK
ncbi:hypothetical protein L209DRAFT_567289 [Thermothelomyces heterothallicus CBS 203.75]